LLIPGEESEAISLLSLLLSHRFPKVRGETAELLYILLETEDFDFDIGEIAGTLSAVEWTEDISQSTADQVIRKLNQTFGCYTEESSVS